MTLVVTIDSDKHDILGEMKVGEWELGTISEMITDPQKLDSFQAGWGAKGAALAQAAEDDKPNFAVLRVEEGWSNSRRLWTARELDSIAEQTNRLEPVGHLGHIPDDQAAFSMPEPQTTWFGAFTRTEKSQAKERVGEMVKVIYLAGYNLPGAKIRTYIKTRAVRGISWWGTGSQVPVPGRGVEVKGFHLKALDWARKLAEGMPTSSVVASTSEMEDQMSDKALSQVTPEEFKKENPNGYALLVSEAVAEKDTKISEMEEKVEEGEKAKSLLAKVCEAVGLDADKTDSLITKIEEIKERVGAKAKTTVSAKLDALLAEKIPGDPEKDPEVARKRELVKRLVPVGEMESKVADAKDNEEAEKLIGEMTDAAFNSDDMIKQIVSEQTPPVVRRRADLKGGSSDVDAAIQSQGMKRERVTLGS